MESFVVVEFVVVESFVVESCVCGISYLGILVVESSFFECFGLESFVVGYL